MALSEPPGANNNSHSIVAEENDFARNLGNLHNHERGNIGESFDKRVRVNFALFLIIGIGVIP
jgi:hypothetical protein